MCLPLIKIELSGGFSKNKNQFSLDASLIIKLISLLYPLPGDITVFRMHRFGPSVSFDKRQAA